MKKLLIFIFLVIIAIFLSRNIIIKESLKYYLKSNFKAKASFEKVNLGFKEVVLHNANLIKDDFQLKAGNIKVRYKFDSLFQLNSYFLKITDARFKNSQFGGFAFDLIPGDKHYRFLVNNLTVKRNEMGDFSLSLKFNKDKLYFSDLESTFIDSATILSGFIDLGDLNNICIDLAIKGLPLSDIVFLFADKKEIELAGKFSGKVNCCFKKNKLSYLDLNIDNLEGGAINLKKETSLDFLKKRVDKRSYSYLLDNLKNYKYDKGSIEADIEKDDIIFEANFSSKELGARNITIKVHNIFAK